jgi:hypothetical protein
MSDVLHDLIEIWKRNGIDPLSNARITEDDLEFGNVKATVGMKGPIWHGKYCGPATHYKDNPHPIDCLDLACKLHDAYFDNPQADNALSESAAYLMENNMIENQKVYKYAQAIDSPMFCAGSNLWRNRTIVFILMAIFLASVGGLGVLFVKLCTK